MPKSKASLIDACIGYIEARDAHYIAKDGLLVYMHSPTGRKTDYIWVKMTITEAIRVIRATRLSPDANLKDHHVIAALQELGRVYEYSTKSRHKVSPEVFNYSDHSEQSLGDSIVHQTVQRLHNMDIKSFYLVEVAEIIQAIEEKLGSGMSVPESRDLLYKHFEGMGYSIKTGAHRPLVRGKRCPVIMAPNTKPKDVESLTKHRMGIINQVWGDLK